MTYDFSSLADTLELPIPSLLAATLGPPPQARVDDPGQSVPEPAAPGIEVPVPSESEIEDPSRRERDFHALISRPQATDA